MGYLYLVKGNGVTEEMKASSMIDAARKFTGRDDVERLKDNDSRFKYKLACVVYKFDEGDLSYPVSRAEFM